jgi:hypothetical protein
VERDPHLTPCHQCLHLFQDLARVRSQPPAATLSCPANS